MKRSQFSAEKQEMPQMTLGRLPVTLISISKLQDVKSTIIQLTVRKSLGFVNCVELAVSVIQLSLSKASFRVMVSWKKLRCARTYAAP